MTSYVSLKNLFFRVPKLKSFLFQISELRVADDEEVAAVRRRAQAVDGAAQAKLRGHENVCAGSP
jgi:hypothetical protein